MRERVGRPASLDIVTLAICLAGLFSLITVTYLLKTGIDSVPRLLFLAFLAMVCAPFFTVFWQVPKPPFLIAPIVVIFLLYPITAPHGIVYGRDPIYNYAFTARVVASGFWTPGGLSGLADTYSLYPLGNVFMAYIVRTANLPGEVGFLWIEPILRLLAVPAIVYAIGRRIFGTRVAILGLLLYMGTASILFNTPVQQEVGTIFVGLGLLSVLMLSKTPTIRGQHRAEVLFALAAVGMVMTHHLSSYIFAGWIIALVVLVAVDRLRPKGFSAQVGGLALYFVLLLILYVVTVSYRIFLVHEQGLEIVVQRIISPESLPSTTTPRLGRTFSLIEQAWLGGSILGILVLAWFTRRMLVRSGENSLAVSNCLIGMVLVVGTLPFLATGAEFVPLRIDEYSNLFIAPFAAATLLRWSRTGIGRWARFMPSGERVAGSLPTAVAILVAAALVIGGNLAPQTMRAYFDDRSNWNTDTPLLFGADSERMAAWGRAHFDGSRVWGDHDIVDIFAGFGSMKVDFGASALFHRTTLNATAWCPAGEQDTCGPRLKVGDYVAVSKKMTLYPSQWFLELEPAVRAPLTPAEVGKFGNDPNFSLVYQDGTFTVYRVMSLPPLT